MFTRRTVTCALVCALFTAAVSVAPAGANERTRTAAALAQERYYQSFGKPDEAPATMSAAEAQERYYSSYGAPAPLTAAHQPAPSDDDTPWLPIALSVAAALAAIAAGATASRRLRVRRRATRVAA